MGSREFRKLYSRAIIYGMNYLSIKIKPQVKFTKLGFCKYGAYNNNQRLIHLNVDHPRIQTLFHEMVHCKQFDVGWLRQDGNKYFWKKRKAEGKGYEIHDYNDYYNSPHEVQARDITINMVERFNRLNGN